MYLDPSFGGMLLQILVAIIAGGGAILFGMRRKVKAWFKKDKLQTEQQETTPVSEDNIVDMMEDESPK